jgi:hypothetical protein
VTADQLVYPVLGALVLFVCFMSLPLLGLALAHLIGKSN